MEPVRLWAAVEFTARSGSTEALLTAAARAGLHLYGVTALPGGFCGHCAARQYPRLAALDVYKRQQPDRKRKTAARNINVQRSFCVGHGAPCTVRCTSSAALPQQCSPQQRPAARSPAARGA